MIASAHVGTRWITAPRTFAITGADVTAGTGMLVSVANLKTRIAIAADDTEHDTYLASLLAAAMSRIHARTGWPTKSGTFVVQRSYDCEEVATWGRRVSLEGPIDSSEAVALVSSTGVVQKQYSWGSDAAVVSRSYGFAGEVQIAAEDLAVSEGKLFYMQYSVSWDEYLGTDPANTMIAEIAYRMAATLYAYRESQNMGEPAAMRILQNSVLTPERIVL